MENPFEVATTAPQSANKPLMSIITRSKIDTVIELKDERPSLTIGEPAAESTIDLVYSTAPAMEPLPSCRNAFLEIREPKTN